MKSVIISLVILHALLLQGCANQLFYYPSTAAHMNDDIRWLPSSSGNALAYLWLPSAVDTPKGIVVHFHGNSGHMEATQEKVNWLVEHGYHVLVFDYSGFGHSSGQPTDEALYHDAMSMLAYSETLQDSMGLPVFVVATSTGGNVFLRAWADHPAEVAGIIIDSSFTSYIETAAFTLRQHVLGNMYAWVASLVMRDDYAADVAMANVPKTNALVLHCEDDEVVPITAGEDLYAELEGDKTFWRLEGCRHARAMTGAFPEVQQRVVDWLAQSTPESNGVLGMNLAKRQ
ncbi:alpha/beta hydrolase [Photobacterium japonica]|uniref:alpha/beta hydrolase n=1 Tax=Photobacterium japonica TaxID=2910235 RepID=UPI003D103362